MPKNKSICANRGEWSELSILARTMVDGQVYSTRHARTISVREIQREDKGGHIKRYILMSGKIYTGDGTEINITDIRKCLNGLERSIKYKRKNEGRSYAAEAGNILLRLLGLSHPKAVSENKSDFSIIIDEEDACVFGVSVKSIWGSDPTLMNASRNTNMVYQIIGCSAVPENNISDTAEILKSVSNAGGEIRFSGPASSCFRENMGTDITELVSCMLLMFYRKEAGPGIPELTEAAAGRLNLDKGRCAKRIKDFLHDVHAGMVPGIPYHGNTDTKAGIMTLNPDSSPVLVGYGHPDSLKHYLYDTCYLERPSRSRHNFGTIVSDDSGHSISLNFQIRMRRTGMAENHKQAEMFS